MAGSERGWSRREALVSAAAAGAWAWLGCGREVALEARSLSDLGPEPFDTCVIGSGPGGAVLAGELLRRGQRVAVLESGVAPERAAEIGWEPGELDAYRADGRPAYPIETTRLRALGGGSNLWEGRCARLLPVDLAPHAYTPPRNPWPLGPDDLDRAYARAEQELGVREPGRRPTEALREVCSGIDLALRAPRIATGPGSRHQPLRAARDLWPGFSTARDGTLVTDATVTRLRSDVDGRVTAAEARTRSGRTRRVEAERFVVACGALESARLLLLSPGPRSPTGLGNRSGWVGRGFGEHPVLRFRGRLPRELGVDAEATSVAHSAGLHRQGRGGATYTLATRRERPRELRLEAAVEMFPDRANRLSLVRDHTDLHGSPGLRLFMRFGMRDRATLEAVRQRVRRIYAALDATDVVEERPGWSHHQLGTCRMGADPQRSVVDADLRVHGTENLHLLSSAVFVTGSAAPPTLTIAALGLRLAERLSRR